MASLQKDLSTPDVSSAAFTTPGIRDDSTAGLIGVLQQGVAAGATIMAKSELAGSEQQTQDQIQAALGDEPELNEANTKTVLDFKKELSKMNAVNKATTEGDARTRAVLKKWVARFPGLANEFRSATASASSIGSDSAFVRQEAESYTKQVEQVKKGYMEVMKKHSLPLSFDPNNLAKLDGILTINQRNDRQKAETDYLKSRGEFTAEAQTMRVADEVDTLALNFASDVTIALDDPSVGSILDQSTMDRALQDEGFRRQVLAQLEGQEREIKSQLRRKYDRIDDFDDRYDPIKSEFQALHDVYSLKKDREFLDGRTDHNLALTKHSFNSSAERRRAKSALDMIRGTSLELDARTFKLMTDWTLNGSKKDTPPLENPIETDLTPDAVREKNSAAIQAMSIMVSNFAKEDVPKGPLREAVNVLMKNTFNQLQGGKMDINSYKMLGDAILQQPKLWADLVNKGIDPLINEKIAKTFENYQTDRVIKSLNAATADLKSGAIFGGGDAEVLQYKVTDKGIVFVPANPRIPSQQGVANKFNEAYGKEYNKAIQVMAMTSGVSVAELNERFSTQLRLSNADDQGEEGSIVSRAKSEGQRGKADFIKRKNLTPSYSEAIKLEKENPSLRNDEEWQARKQEAFSSGNIGEITDPDLFDEVKAELEKQKPKGDEQASISNADLLEVAKQNPDAPMSELLEFAQAKGIA